MSKDEINNLIQMLRSKDESDVKLAFGIIQENIREFKPEELVMLFLSNSHNQHLQSSSTSSEIKSFFYKKIFKQCSAYAGGGWGVFIQSIPYTYDELINIIKNNGEIGFRNNNNVRITFKDFCQNFSLNFNL